MHVHVVFSGFLSCPSAQRVLREAKITLLCGYDDLSRVPRVPRLLVWPFFKQKPVCYSRKRLIEDDDITVAALVQSHL